MTIYYTVIIMTDETISAPGKTVTREAKSTLSKILKWGIPTGSFGLGYLFGDAFGMSRIGDRIIAYLEKKKKKTLSTDDRTNWSRNITAFIYLIIAVTGYAIAGGWIGKAICGFGLGVAVSSFI